MCRGGFRISESGSGGGGGEGVWMYDRWGGGAPCCMSIIRNGNVALSN